MNFIDSSLPHYHRHQSKYLHLILHSFWPSILQLIHSSLQLSNFPLIGHSATHQSTHQSSVIQGRRHWGVWGGVTPPQKFLKTGKIRAN